MALLQIVIIERWNDLIVYITGDCHSIVCGDSGILNDNDDGRWWLRWISEEVNNFTLLFVDGDRENFDRLYSDEFEVVDFHGGKAHKIRENKGYVFELCGKKFFAFGGATSTDVDNGILEPRFVMTEKGRRFTKEFERERRNRAMRGDRFRINHISWWEQELPTQEEMDRGLRSLEEHNNEVDFVITHCCPQHILPLLRSYNGRKQDILTEYFDKISEQIQFKKWFFGHYHNNQQVTNEYYMLYEQIVRVV